MQDLLTNLASSGVLGAILALVIFAYQRKDQQYREVQEARVTDSSKVLATVLEMQEKWQVTLTALERAVDRLPKDR